MPVIICSGGNFSYQIKTQLEQLSLNSMEEDVCVVEFLCMHVLYLCECVYAHGKEQSKELCGGAIV